MPHAQHHGYGVAEAIRVRLKEMAEKVGDVLAGDGTTDRSAATDRRIVPPAASPVVPSADTDDVNPQYAAEQQLVGDAGHKEPGWLLKRLRTKTNTFIHSGEPKPAAQASEMPTQAAAPVLQTAKAEPALDAGEDVFDSPVIKEVKRGDATYTLYEDGTVRMTSPTQTKFFKSRADMEAYLKSPK